MAEFVILFNNLQHLSFFVERSILASQQSQKNFYAQSYFYKVAQHISRNKRNLYKVYAGRMEKRKTVIFTEKLKTSMIEKHFAIINCSDTAYLAEAQQDQSLIVLEAIQT